MPTNAINDTGVKYLYDKLHDEIEGCINDDVETVIGNPLNFSTKFAQHAKSTKLTLEPIQDLHGYKIPWTGGDGKNKLDTSDVTVSGISFNEDSEHYISANPNNTDTRSWSYSASQYKFTLPAGSYKLVAEVKTVTTESSSRVRLYDSSENMIFDEGDALKSVGIKSYDFTLSASAEIGFIAKQYESVARFMIIASNETTSYAPYKNICPISGYDEIDLNGCGKNLLKNELVSATECDVSFITQADGRIKVYGTASGSVYKTDICTDFSLPEGNYTLSYEGVTNLSIQVCNRAENVQYASVAINRLSQPLVVTSDMVNDMRVRFIIQPGNQVDGTTGVMIREASIEDDTFEPYQESNNLSINLPSTVYSGVLDLESGELVVDNVRKILTSSDIQGVSSGSSTDSMGGKRINTTILDAKYCGSMSELSNIISNCLETVSAGKIYNQSPPSFCCSVNDAGQITIRVNGATTVADAQSYVTNNEIQVCYELATPQTIQLTPHQLNLFKEQNNISSNVTSISVTYKKGILTVIEPATESSDGIMSAADKQKLDSIADDATKTGVSSVNGHLELDDEDVTVYDDTEVKDAISDIDDIITTDETTIEGNPINFTTLSAQNAKSTILSVEPIQDLHGYSKPWVGGAGDNKLPLTSQTISNYGITASISDSGEISITGGNTSGATQAIATSSLITLKAGKTYYLNAFWNSSSYGPAKNSLELSIRSSGSTLFTENTIYTPNSDIIGYLYIRLQNGYTITGTAKCTPMVTEGSQASAYSPYKNECPISGRSEIGILGCGKNLLPLTVEGIKASNTSGSWSGNTYAYSEGTVTILTDNDGNVTGLKANGTFTGTLIFVLGTYTLSANTYALNGCASGGSSTTYYLDWRSDNNSQMIETGSSPHGYVYTSSGQTGKQCRLIITNTTISNLIFKPMIRLNSDIYTFEPYTKSNDLLIDLGQTVYGGTLDVENGVLVVGRKYKTLDELNYTKETSGDKKFFSSTTINSEVKKPSTNADVANAICSQYEVTSTNAVLNATGRISVNQWGGVIIYDENYSEDDATAFKNHMANVDFVYELATPIEIQLTPHTINLLKGVNNISTDGDKITLTYRDGSVATLGDLTSAVDELDGKIEDSKILTDTVTGDKYILVVTNGVLDIQQISN